MAPEILKSLGKVTCSSVAVVDTFCGEVQGYLTLLRKAFCSVVLLLYYTGQLISLYLCKSFRNLIRQAKGGLKNVGGIASLTEHTLNFIVQCALCLSKM